MNVRRVVSVAAMHARDLSRRRVALAILILLPVVLYLSAELTPPDPATAEFLAQNPGELAASESWILTTGGIGPVWSVAVAALFVILGSRAADQRLLLVGFRPTELLGGRMLTVLGLGAVITPAFTALIWAVRDVDAPMLALGIALLVLVALGQGVIVAALVRDEMEGVLAIIGITGVQMMMVGQAWLPMWGGSELMLRSAGLPDTADPATAVLHTAAFTVGLVGLGAVIWARRVRLHAALPLGAAAALDVAEAARRRA